MRTALITLLLLVAGVPLFASPAVSVDIITSRTVCLNGINHARAETNAGPGAKYAWSVANGAILSGQGTPEITYTPVEAGSVVVAVTVDSGPPARVAVGVFATPAITSQPHGVSIAPGARAHLSVATTEEAQSFEWFEGAVGDTTKLVGRLFSDFTTPPLTKTTSYWVRVSSFCGAVSSQAAVVTVTAGKRRAAGH